MKIFKSISNLSRLKKIFFLILIDITGLILSAILALWIGEGNINSTKPYSNGILILPFITIPIFIRTGLYRAVIRYIGFKFSQTLFISTSLSFIIWFLIIYTLNLNFPKNSIIIAYLLSLFFVLLTRTLLRHYSPESSIITKNYDNKKSAIFGAGSSGQQLLGILNKTLNYQVVAFIDDNKSLQGSYIENIKIYERTHLQYLIENFGVSEVFIAIPSLSTKNRKDLIKWLEPYKVKVSTLPTFNQIVNGHISFNDIKQVEPEDLLGREPIPPKPELLSRCITDKTVFVSGAGGSIGSELCRQIIRQSPKILILYEASEFALYQVEKELRAFVSSKTKIISLLGSVLDPCRLNQILTKYTIDTIYHAAAYKHVPIVEHNIYEGFKNNTFGTLTLAKLSAQHQVSNFVLISTDKAVRPCNFMGASKRLAEMVLQALQAEFPKTIFTMVRFGNVLGSSGSVIPLFKQQIAQGGPVTVTHPEITRYFMTLSEAASLVIQAGSMGKGGDVFVLDMGQPVKIVDLAIKIIKLSGLEVINEKGEGDIEIRFTGLRPGEKLYEELLIGDHAETTQHPRVLRAHDHFIEYELLIYNLNKLEALLKHQKFQEAVALIQNLVSGFSHSDDISDWLI